ncbi:hypothetical protein SAMN02799630_03984 [Paenibacillus sp. UNCCL117]|uniref:hypothetical protein n=1 Tax=unclassified Paenibacillus TaxID=185978 RepID=UPI00088C0EFB|nr:MULTISPECIES: hypothetical protein [unclassified Paenibacillus]SDD76837.1 hypothetical protein SAMN04488602_11349 [Paenibacillus sp. cl123]SFW52563.1 hypothetical protein SAMN02799630_03984 [Paenibacillus sp. UNCCL117]
MRERVLKAEQQVERRERGGQGPAPIIVWESRRADGGSSQEATVRELHTGSSAGGAEGPVIRVTSSGFGQQAAEARLMAGRPLSCAA